MKWWTKSWNPVIGCTPCSPACDNCYAERLHTQRHEAFKCGADMPLCYAKPFGEVTWLADRLEQPLHWRKPQRIFVGNMGDLFHPDVTDGQLRLVFHVMANAQQHTFMLLTKRPERMREYVSGGSAGGVTWREGLTGRPLPNVWHGATVWDQASMDAAAVHLLKMPIGARLFLSIEPMLGPVVIPAELLARLAWVICGGETGPGARPMHPDWPRSLRDQCQAAGVPFFFKQWGEWSDMPWRVYAERCVAITPDGQTYSPDAAAFNAEALPEDAALRCRVGTKRSGRKLDGQVWQDVPA